MTSIPGLQTGNFLDNPPVPNPPPPTSSVPTPSRCVPSLCQTIVEPTQNPVIRPNRENADLGNFLYLADRDFRVVHVVNSTTGLPLDAIETPDPMGLAVDPDFEFLFVTNFATNSVSVVDIQRGCATRHQVIKEIFVGLGPRCVCVQPDKDVVFVLNTVGDISILDFATLTIRKTLNPSRSRAFVS